MTQEVEQGTVEPASSLLGCLLGRKVEADSTWVLELVTMLWVVEEQQCPGTRGRPFEMLRPRWSWRLLWPWRRSTSPAS